MLTPEEIDSLLRDAGLPAPEDPSDEAAVIDKTKLPEATFEVPQAPVPPLPADAQTEVAPEHGPLVAEAKLRDEERKARKQDPHAQYQAPIPEPEVPEPEVDPHAEYMAQPPPEPEPPPDPHAQYMAKEEEPEPELFDPHTQYMRENAPAPSAPPPPKKKAPPADEGEDEDEAPPSDKDEVVSTAPGWYEALAPPKTSALPGVLGSLGMGLLGALLARKDPTVAAGMAGLGGLGALGELIAGPQRDYYNRLGAAERQAAMHAKLSGGGSDGLAGERNKLAWEKWRAQQEEDARKAAEHEALEGMDTPQTIAERKIMRDLSVGPKGELLQGGLTDQQLGTMNGNQIRRYRVALEHQANQARGAEYGKQGFNRRETAKVEGEVRAENRQLAEEQRAEERTMSKEDREQLVRDEQAFIPGYKFTGKRAPNIAAVEKGRAIADQAEIAEMATAKMVPLWNQLNTKARLAPGWLEGALSDEDRSIVNELRAWGLNLDTAQRALALMGVPQQFEMEIIRNVSPDATGIRALLNNGTAWAAQGRVLGQLIDKRMQKYGYTREAPAAPVQAASSGDASLPGKLAEAGQGTAALVQDAVGAAGQMVKNAGNTAQKVAGAVAPGLKQIRVRKADGTLGDVLTVTAEELEAAKAKLKALGRPESDIDEVAP